jgi:hypothetical protein
MTGSDSAGGGAVSRGSAISCLGADSSADLSGQTTEYEALGIAILAAGTPKHAAMPRSMLSNQAVGRSLIYEKYDTRIA